MKALGEDVPGYKIRDMIREVDLDENGTVEFNEFLEVGCWERQYFNTVQCTEYWCKLICICQSFLYIED